MPVSSWFRKASVAKLIAWLAVERFTEQLCNCALRFKGGISDAEAGIHKVDERSVLVSMMDIRVVRVAMRTPRMSMPMSMRFAWSHRRRIA